MTAFQMPASAAPAAYAMMAAMAAAQKITFTGSSGGELAARLDLPAGPARALAVFAHCFTCSKDIFAVSRIAAELNEQDIGVLRFDFTGLGASEGDFSNTNFSSNLEDLRSAIRWLADHHGAPQLLIGHSLGGAAVLAVASEFDSVRAVVSIAAPAELDHVAGVLGASNPDVLVGDQPVEVQLAGRPFTIKPQFIADLANHRITEAVSQLRKALLVIHSPLDNQVGIEHAERIFASARHPKSYLSINADHLLTRRGEAEYVARAIGTWAERYIEEPDSYPAPEASAQVVVGETGQGKFLNHVVAGRHRSLADEPESIGGFDAGMSPYDYLAAALGACTTMTVRMYADHKKLPLDRVVVEVNHDKVHSDDSAAASGGARRRVDQFTRRLHLTGDLDDETRRRMLEIADRCPVHLTLHESSKIVTVLADDGS